MLACGESLACATHFELGSCFCSLGLVFLSSLLFLAFLYIPFCIASVHMHCTSTCLPVQYRHLLVPCAMLWVVYILWPCVASSFEYGILALSLAIFFLENHKTWSPSGSATSMCRLVCLCYLVSCLVARSFALFMQQDALFCFMVVLQTQTVGVL